MRRPAFTRQFERDLRLMARRGKDLALIRAVMAALIAEEPLDARHRDHPLTGEYRDRRDCHVESDWVLIYSMSESTMTFERTGTHADLFE